MTGEKAIILHIETSTEVCSVCLSEDSRIIELIEDDTPFSHSSNITLFIDQLFQSSNYTLQDLTAVSISQGPGSYTGLRVGLSAAKGICFANDIPLIAVDSLSVIAQGVKDQIKPSELVIPMIDARRMEVYASVFNAQMIEISPVDAVIIDECSFKRHRDQPWVLCGNGAQKTVSALNFDQIRILPSFSSSRFMIDLVLAKYYKDAFEDLAYFSPSYFKAPHITSGKNILAKN